MKKAFLFVAVALGMIACSENPSSNGNAEKKFALQLNEDCLEFKADSSVWEAIEDSDLGKLKKVLNLVLHWICHCTIPHRAVFLSWTGFFSEKIRTR